MSFLTRSISSALIILLPTVGTIVNFVVMHLFKVCLSHCLNICLGYESLKKFSVLKKFGYIFAISNINFCTKNREHMLGNFYTDKSKS